ncbi:MAG: epoxyqueuosine reductase QueH [Dysgonamonadaceae bacterium]|jgi:predicted adenine nucleotide alpha hydrolase (AANH) superfamily ATPase|nr:epoxyqueuosine reductase QueH [Dysgonamonadaceae bacterium]
MLLLHTCCAPCSAAVIEWLLKRDIYPALLFFNPNIYPQTEYEIRKNEWMRYAGRLKLECIDGDYDHSSWLQTIKGLENQPERGARCLACFKMRLLATAQLAHEKGFTQIATTLASSRWKSLEQIAEAGQWAVSRFPDMQFWDKNWRKDGLSERRRTLLQENGFYNQRYCGCEFSQRLTSPAKLP